MHSAASANRDLLVSETVHAPFVGLVFVGTAHFGKMEVATYQAIPVARSMPAVVSIDPTTDKAAELLQSSYFTLGLTLMNDLLGDSSCDDVFADDVSTNPDIADRLLSQPEILLGLNCALEQADDTHLCVAVRVIRMLLQQSTSVDDVVGLVHLVLPTMLGRVGAALDKNPRWLGLSDCLAACHAASSGAAAHFMSMNLFPTIALWCVRVSSPHNEYPASTITAVMALVCALLSDEDVREFVDFEPESLGIARSQLKALAAWLGKVNVSPARASCRSAIAAAHRAATRLLQQWNDTVRSQRNASEKRQRSSEQESDASEDDAKRGRRDCPTPPHPWPQ